MRKQIIDVILTYYVMLPYAVVNVGFALSYLAKKQKALVLATPGVCWDGVRFPAVPC